MKISTIARILLFLSLSALALCILTFFSGCYTKKQAINKFCKAETRIHDSVSYNFSDSTRWKIEIYDSTIIHPAVTQIFNLDDLCDSLGRLRKVNIDSRTGGSHVSIITQGNKLIITSGCDSIVQRLRHEKDSLVQRSTANNVEYHNVDRIVKLPAPAWYKTVPKIMWWIIAAMVGYCGWNLFNFLKPLIKKLVV